MQLEAEELKAFVRSRGADLVGIAPANRLAGSPPQHRPADILPDAKSIIVCGKPMPRGTIAFAPPTGYDNTMVELNSVLDRIACEIAVWLEKQGATAVPIPADRPYWDYDPETKRGHGDISHKHAAVAAGLGLMGTNTLLITPQFGNRVQLVSVLTNAELEPDRPLEGNPCPAGCTLCVDACPVGAIDPNGKVDQALCRSHMYLHLPRGYTVEGCRECRRVCPFAQVGAAALFAETVLHT